MGTEISEGFEGFFKNVDNNPFIIPLPSDGKDSPKKYVRYVIDSRDRNHNIYSSPSKYELLLFENLSDVSSVELLVANVPFSRYNIHEHNNVLHYDRGNDIENVSFSEGDYENLEDLILEMNSKLNPSSITVTLNNTNKKLTFVSDNAFSFTFKGNMVNHTQHDKDYLWKENSIGKVLGFRIKDYTATHNSTSGKYELVSEYPICLEKDNYIIMRMSRAKIYSSNTKTADTCFAIINNSCGELNNDYVSSLIKTFNPPLSSFDRIKISFHDYYGNLYNFNNRDHRIELKFGLLKQGRRIE